MDEDNKKTVTKKDIIEHVSLRTGLTRRDVRAIIEVFLEAIEIYLTDGKQIEFREFGRFKTKMTKQRIGRNPKNGAAATIMPFIKPVFRVSKQMIKRINEINKKPQEV